MPQNEFIAPLLICFFFVFFFYFVFDFDFINRGDFEFHYRHSAGLEAGEYAPLSHLVGRFFAYNKQNFVLCVLLLVFVVTPMLLWHIYKSWLTVLFFFATQYPFFMLMSISQGMAGVFLLGLFVSKNNYLRFLMLLGGAASHSKGGILILIAWGIIMMMENKHIFTSIKKFFPACSTLIGRNVPEFASKQLPIAVNQPVSLLTIGNFFLKIIPFPFLFLGLIQLWKEKNFAPIMLFALSFLAIFYQADRTLYIAPLIIVPYSAKFTEKQSFKLKLIVILIAVIFIIFQIWSWIRVKTVCG